MKSKSKIFIVIILLLQLVINIYLIVEKENIQELKEETTIPVRKPEKALSMMLETEAGSGNYELTTASSWPTEGYIFNSTLSKCENGGELSWDDTNKKVLMSGNMSDKCYVYFDAVQKAVINEIITSDITLSSMTITINATKGTFDISKYYYSIDNGATWNESTSNIISISGLTKGTTYAIKAYVQDARKINSDYKIVNASTLDITIITFTIDGTQYYAEENMTWKEWVESKYSNNDYYTRDTFIFDKASNGRKRITYYLSDGKDCTPENDEKIIANQDYYLIKNSEPS